MSAMYAIYGVLAVVGALLLFGLGVWAAFRGVFGSFLSCAEKQDDKRRK